MRISKLGVAMPAIAALGLLVAAGAAKAQVIEGFENVAVSDFTDVSWGGLDAAITTGAAHDGTYGLHFGGDNADWLWRSYSNSIGPGQTIDAYVRFDSVADGRIYVALGATTAGAMSMVLAANTSALILQMNSGWDFSDLAATPFSFAADTWYRMETVYDVNTATVNLYNDTSNAVLATLSATGTGFSSTGGLGFRGFGGGGVDIDTAFRPTSVPEPGSLALLIGLAVPCSALALRRRQRR